MTHDQGHAPQPVAPQQRLIAGRYAIVSEIGRGGMGIVWLAEDRMIGRRVAIKELHLPEGVPADERGVFEERVLREARTAGRLNDPAVVTVFDVLQESGNTYIVMELIEAPTLSDIVRRSGPLPQDAVAALAGQLLSALEAAHTAGITHRDVKPSNIMVLPSGRVKLTDFGIAQSVDDPRLTTSGILIGSPTYMAPERIRGGEAVAGSDLWALGAVLFFAVEGRSPFERSSTAATMHAIMNEVPYLTRCQGPLASVIMGLLINTPEARLSAAQVRGLLAQGPSHTGPQTVMLGGTAVYPPPNTTMIAPGAPPHRQRRNGARRWLAIGLSVVLAAGIFVGGWFAHGWLTAPANATEAANGGTMTYGDGGDIPEFNISPGSCAAAELRKRRSYPSTSDCKEAHDLQVYGSVEALSESGDVKVDYPGQDGLTRFGEAWCSMVFASKWVKKSDKHTTLTFVTLIPAKGQWDKSVNSSADEREVVCVLQSRDGSQLSASMLAEP